MHLGHQVAWEKECQRRGTEPPEHTPEDHRNRTDVTATRRRRPSAGTGGEKEEAQVCARARVGGHGREKSRDCDRDGTGDDPGRMQRGSGR